ncbi:hypothetical protein [Psychrobacter cibarius]|nr:hypothetical protein [Psychrobacter cibarius]
MLRIINYGFGTTTAIDVEPLPLCTDCLTPEELTFGREMATY